ncbi:MAG: flagellar basal body P-ring formation chaperone FlgA [Planctomycetota bacterium]|jgi:flagella basal body P-ring formation protein FlgA|nr:flagellar basal body P-ring formation chaperone FlgA [Planctomycetota bacterium]
MKLIALSILVASTASAQTGRLAFVVRSSEETKSHETPNRGVLVRLREKATVRGLEFTVGEVAHLFPADTALAKRIRRMVVSRSPMPGYTQRVTPDIIRMTMRGKVRDLSEIKVANGMCAVKCASARVPGEFFEEAGRKHILKKLPFAPSDVQIKPTKIVQDRFVPVGLGSGPVLEITDADQPTSSTMRVHARVIVDDREVFNIVLSYSIKTYQDVAILAEPVREGTLLTPEHITMERRQITNFDFGYFTDPTKLYGKIAPRKIRKGTLLTDKLVKDAPVIFPKSMISILYRSGKLDIKLDGLAEQAGAPGDIIRVRNLNTRRSLWAKVINSKTVTVTN